MDNNIGYTPPLIMTPNPAQPSWPPSAQPAPKPAPQPAPKPQSTVPSPTNIIDIPQLIGQFILGISYDLQLFAEKFLIYSLFGGVFLILVYSAVTDQSPQEIVVNTAKTAGKVAAIAGEVA
jgi:hypothetical protein